MLRAVAAGLRGDGGERGLTLRPPQQVQHPGVPRLRRRGGRLRGRPRLLRPLRRGPARRRARRWPPTPVFPLPARLARKAFALLPLVSFPFPASRFRSAPSSDLAARRCGRFSQFLQDLAFNWRVVVATVVGFLGSAFGTVGGVGGGGIFVPMLNLLVGFDTKSAAALSKCKLFPGTHSQIGEIATSSGLAFRTQLPMHASADLLLDDARAGLVRFGRRHDHGRLGVIRVVQSPGVAPDQGGARHRLQAGAALPAHAHARHHHRSRAQRHLPLLAHHRPHHNPLCR